MGHGRSEPQGPEEGPETAKERASERALWDATRTKPLNFDPSTGANQTA